MNETAPKKRPSMPREKRKRKIIEVSVSDETRERLARLSIETGRARSKIVEDALELYESERAKAKELANSLGFLSK